MGRPTIGRCGVFRYILQIAHSSLTFLINFFSSSSDCHGSPAELSNFSSFSGEGCDIKYHISLGNSEPYGKCFRICEILTECRFYHMDFLVIVFIAFVSCYFVLISL